MTGDDIGETSSLLFFHNVLQIQQGRLKGLTEF